MRKSVLGRNKLKISTEVGGFGALELEVGSVARERHEVTSGDK